MTTLLEILRPDDWHLHLRDGAMLSAVLPWTARVFGRAIVMPNLKPPVRTTMEALAYRDRIRACLPVDHPFEPLMTSYLTDNADPADLGSGYQRGVLTAAKLYPAGATTNAEHGVTDIRRLDGALDTMQTLGMPLLVHGEVTDPEVDVFDREAVFIERVLEPLRRRFPALRVVFEHITTADAVDYVKSSEAGLAATITPHHLMINRNALFAGGLRPHHYCLPVAKRERHRLALRAAATSGDRRFFLGTDSAPHPLHLKETDCGCAGIFNAPTTLGCVAEVFEEEGALEKLEGFCSRHGPAFYRLPENTDRITLTREVDEVVPREVETGDGERVRVFPDRASRWRVTAGLR